MRTILLIDDSALMRSLMRELLEAEGMRVVELPTTVGATREAARHRVDAVLIDVVLPGLTGDKIVPIFRKHAKLADVSLILISGEDDAELFRLARETKVEAAVSKRQLTQLVPTLQRVLEHRDRQRLRRGVRPSDTDRPQAPSDAPPGRASARPAPRESGVAVLGPSGSRELPSRPSLEVPARKAGT